MSDVFISYASEDRSRIQPLVDALHAEGWSVWWDRELTTGGQFDDEIERALTEARCVVVAWSEHSVRKIWCRAEASAGLERQVLVPFRLDDTRPPLPFRQCQTVSLVDWPERRAGLDELIRGVRGMLEHGTQPDQRLENGTVVVGHRQANRPRWWLGAVALIAIASLFAVQMFNVRAVQAPPVDLTSPKSIAVLRFRNVDENTDHAYLAEGLAGALVDALNQVPALAVMDRGRSFQHSIANETVQAIGTTLDVDHVLAGSMEVLGERMRVSAALYSREGEQLYVYRDDEPIAQFLSVQDKVVSNVLTALEIHLDAHEAELMRDWGTRNVDAYLAAVEADSFHKRLDQKSLHYAAVRLREAIALDPGFLLAHAILAHTLADLALFTPDTTDRLALREELVWLRQAVEHLDGNADAFAAIDIAERKMTMRSLRELEVVVRAHIQDEGTPHRAHGSYVEFAELLKTGHLFREAAQYLDLYQQFAKDDLGVLLPRTELAGLTLGPQRAMAMEKKSLTVFQNNVGMLTSLVLRLALIGDYEEAERYLARLEENDQSGMWTYSARLFLDVLRGDLPAGSEQLRAALDDPRCNDYLRGVTYFILGDVATGVAWWEKARANVGGNRFPVLFYLVNNESMYPASVLDDSRYQNYLEEAGMGRNWTAYLRAKVAELAPITGILPGDPAPQVVHLTR